MKTLLLPLIASVLVSSPLLAAEPVITPEMQAVLDTQKKIIAKWAADPVLVAAVQEQNKVGPIEGMNNAKWKALPETDPQVIAFQKSPAGKWLSEQLEKSDGFFSEAFLNGAKGEKAAFAEKTTRYIHLGQEKFDVPMKGESWQGKPELDESTKTAEVQIATPVLDAGKPIGVLVVGVSLRKLGDK